MYPFLRNYYDIAVNENLDGDSYLDKIADFKQAFNTVHELWGLTETPKNHILSVHVGEYIALIEETLWSCNDENLEGCHQLVKRRCRRHNVDINKNLVGPHKRKCTSSLISISNSKNKRYKK